MTISKFPSNKSKISPFFLLFPLLTDNIQESCGHNDAYCVFRLATVLAHIFHGDIVQLQAAILQNLNASYKMQQSRN